MTKSCILLGAGGHSKVLMDILEQTPEYQLVGVSAKDKVASDFTETVTVYDSDEALFRLDPLIYALINGVGFLPYKNIRQKLFMDFHGAGFKFLSLVSDKAVIGSSVTIAEGVQILPSTTINSGARIGVNTIVNTGAIIEHDAVVGAHSHIAPGAIVCGDVTIGNSVFVGAGAVIVQGISIGDGAVIGAGAVVLNPVSEGQVVVGKH